MNPAQFLNRTVLTLAITAVLTGTPLHAKPDTPKSNAAAAPPDQVQLEFSVDKMDLSVDPRQDFYHFAAGRWLDAVEIPNDRLRVTTIEELSRAVSKQLQHILEQAAANNADAEKGSPLQQMGDFYASGMDEARLKSLGITPLQPSLDTIDAIDSPQALAQALAELGLMTDDAILFAAAVKTDIQDSSVYGVIAGGAELGMPSSDDYLNKDKAANREAYLNYVAANFELLGNPSDQAMSEAHTVLEMETRLAGSSLTPVEMADPNKLFTAMTMEELESLLSNFDLQTYLEAIGLPAVGKVTVFDRKKLAELNRVLKDYSLADIKILLRWSVLRQLKKALSPVFDASGMAYLNARYGKIEQLPRSEQVTLLVPTLFGHPLSQLYVDEYFTGDSRKRVEVMVAKIKSLFRQRLEVNTWLSEATRDAAIEKLDRLTIDVGYPGEWIDYSSVEVRRDDFFGNVVRRNQFNAQRNLDKLGEPVKEDGFSSPGATLPIDINAAYSPSKNKIEIPAAFLQPPFFNPTLDEAVNYCSIGAVIGHEMTHGFDSIGRLYDADGNLRDWWTEEDAAKFIKQTQKLVEQADAYQVLPGLHLNGKLTVTENLADLGGISLAYEGLQSYLQEQPDANKKIDGYTPQQRCFLAWAQVWASKSREALSRQLAETDAHSPGPYRTFAPSQHEAGFFEAFSIVPGDPVWRAEADRVTIW